MHRTHVWARLISRRAVASFLVLAIAALLGASEAASASEIKEVTLQSAALGRSIAVSVYRPDGPAPAAGWPVFYLLHGLNGCYRDWPALGGVQKTLDSLIATRRIKPMLVVMPDGGNSWYVDSAAVGGPGNYETAFLDDLPKAIEQNYPVRHDRGGRAIAGLSMGGFGALRLALKRPDRYVAVASLSGAIWQNMPTDETTGAKVRVGGADYFLRVDPATIVSGIDRPPEGNHFGAAFGAPFDVKRFNAANVFTLLAQQLRSGADLPAIYLTVGDHDSHDLWRGSIALYETLMADGVNVDFRVTGGDHVWALWRHTIEDALVFADSKFVNDAPAVADAHAASKFAGVGAAVK